MANNGSSSGVVPAVDTTAPEQEQEFNPLEMLMQMAAEQATAEPEPEPEEEYGPLPMTEAEYMAQQGAPNAAQEKAIDVYLYPHATDGTLYSPSQQINYALRMDKPVPAKYQHVVKGMDSMMHDLGYNANLTRYDRVGFLWRLLDGQNHENMTEAQLRDKLVGMSYQDKGLVSTSHNDFVNAPAKAKQVFKEKTVEIRIKAKSGTQAMMPGNGGGGALGEIVLGRNQWFKITDVKMPAGVKGRSGDQWYQKVILEVEVG